MQARQIHLDLFKVLACLLMLFDHIAHFAELGYLWRVPGRFVLPMFAMSLAYKLNGRGAASVIKRLLIWAMVTQVLLFAVGLFYFNIFFTLLLGLSIATAQGWLKLLLIVLAFAIEYFTLYTGQMLIEYGAAGVMMVAASYWTMTNAYFLGLGAMLAVAMNHGVLHQCIAAFATVGSYFFVRQLELFAWVERVPTWAWYAFYPVHMLLIWAFLL